jgi:peptide/nickel transport system substrate-binding protein
LRLGVVGELRVAGGAVADLVLGRSGFGDGWDLGASFRRLKR